MKSFIKEGAGQIARRSENNAVSMLKRSFQINHSVLKKVSRPLIEVCFPFTICSAQID
jgi:hypothetical protein